MRSCVDASCGSLDQGEYRISQVVDPLASLRAGDDDLVVRKGEGLENRARALRLTGAGDLVTLGQDDEHRRAAAGQETRQRSVVFAGISADIQQPDDAGERFPVRAKTLP